MKKLITIALFSIFIITNMSSNVFASSSINCDPTIGKILGDISRGNPKDCGLDGTNIIVPRPAKSQYVGGYGNGDNTKMSKSVNFTDIKGHWAENYINSFASKGYISGYKDGTFKPNSPITYAEMLSVLANLDLRPVRWGGALPMQKQNTTYTTMGNTTTNIFYTTPYFITDLKHVIKDNEWFVNSLNRVSECGILGNDVYYDGMTGAKMVKGKISDNATRETVCLYLSNMLDYNTQDENTSLNFSDTEKISKDINTQQIPSFAPPTSISDNLTLNAVKAMVSDKIISGYTDGSFKPQGNITRAEFVVMVQKILDLYGDDKNFVSDNLYSNFYRYGWEQDKLFFDAVNKARADNGVAPLQYNADLTAIARIRCIDMVVSHNISHDSTSFNSDRNNIYKIFGLDKPNGENITGGANNYNGNYENGSYMGDAPHKQNVLNTNYTAVGVASLQDINDEFYMQ